MQKAEEVFGLTFAASMRPPLLAIWPTSGCVQQANWMLKRWIRFIYLNLTNRVPLKICSTLPYSLLASRIAYSRYLLVRAVVGNWYFTSPIHPVWSYLTKIFDNEADPQMRKIWTWKSRAQKKICSKSETSRHNSLRLNYLEIQNNHRSIRKLPVKGLQTIANKNISKSANLLKESSAHSLFTRVKTRKKNGISNTTIPTT